MTYRWIPRRALPEDPDQRRDAINRFNERIIDLVREDGRVFLSSTMLDGNYILRLVALAFRTHKRTIDLALRILKEKVEQLEALGEG